MVPGVTMIRMIIRNGLMMHFRLTMRMTIILVRMLMLMTTVTRTGKLICLMMTTVIRMMRARLTGKTIVLIFLTMNNGMIWSMMM